jgi:hypothetical protein
MAYVSGVWIDIINRSFLFGTRHSGHENEETDDYISTIFAHHLFFKCSFAAINTFINMESKKKTKKL